MDFLRSVEEDLTALIAETKKKMPMVRDAADKGIEQIVIMRQMYAQSMRVEAAPGPGHAVFKSDAILRPFLLVCNHSNANSKLLVSCFNSIQRLVSWDAITSEAIGNILRVLQIQAEHNTSQDIQLKLLQTLLQLLTLAFNKGDEQMTNDDLISQAMWICLHLQSQSGNAITSNTAAMTVRQIVTMVFDNVVHHQESSEIVMNNARKVGFLVFQDLCLMSREESGVWMKRTTFSKLLGVELVEAVLTSHSNLFRTDIEFRSMLKQHIKTLITMNLDTLLSPANISNPTTFPLLLRIMRLASTVLLHFTALLPDECCVIWLALLDIISTGSFSPSSPPVKTFNRSSSAVAGALTANTTANNSAANSSTGQLHHITGNYFFVTWPVLLAMEVVTKACHEAEVIPALSQYQGHILAHVARTVSAVVTTSPPADYKPPVYQDVTFYRSGLEYLNDTEAPPLQPFFQCLRLAVVCQHQMIAGLQASFPSALGSLPATATAPEVSPLQAQYILSSIAPYVLNAFNCTMRFCREAELIAIALKSLHALTSIDAAVRAKLPSTIYNDHSMDLRPIGVACLQTLCVFSFPTLPASRIVKCITGTGQPSVIEYTGEDMAGLIAEEPLLTWREIQAMKALFRTVHTMENELNTAEWQILLEGFEVIVALSTLKQKSKGVHTKMGTGPQALKVEDEDVEQQLVMLGFSIHEYFHNSTNEGILRPEALLHVLEALGTVCFGQLHTKSPIHSPTALSSDTITENVTPDDRLVDSLRELVNNHTMLAWDVLIVPFTQHLKVYDQTLGLSSMASGAAFQPSFAIRMFVQLAKQHHFAWSFVMRELVHLSCAVPSTPPNASVTTTAPSSFQTYTTDAVFQLMQSAILLPDQKMTQPEICSYMTLILQSETMKERALLGLLDFLQGCGHLLDSGWPVVLSTLESSAIFDSRCQVVAFKSVRLIVDDLIVNMPLEYRKECISCVGAYASAAKDVNISLTAVNALWSIADAIAKQAKVTTSLWPKAFDELKRIAVDSRPEVRNCAINTLFGMAVTHGSQFGLVEWKLFIEDTVLPLGTKLSVQVTNDEPLLSAPGIMTHHSRDSVSKQYDESRVLVLNGIARVIQTHNHALMSFDEWFPTMWDELLAYIAAPIKAATCSKEVVLASVSTVQTLLQFVSSNGIDPIATPLRAGVGMRMVDGSLAAASEPTTSSRRQSRASQNPQIWESAFTLLLQIVLDNTQSTNMEINQEIASAVVHVLVLLYNQCKLHECSGSTKAHCILSFFETCMDRYVFAKNATVAAGTTNSVHYRILNAYEECNFFEPDVHTALIDQLLVYLHQAASCQITFLIKHILTTLAKVYENITTQAQAATSANILEALQPFLNYKVQDLSTAMSLTPSEKSTLQLWKPALKVINVLIQYGINANLAIAPHLFASIEMILGPAPTREFEDPSDDEVLELNSLDLLVQSISRMVPANPDVTSRFISLLTSSNGRRVPVASACVHHLITLGAITNTNVPLRQVCRLELLTLAKEALAAYLLDPNENRARVLTLLSTLGASPLSPRNVLDLFPSLCACISCDDLDIRTWIQRILIDSNVATTCLALLTTDD
ncbi:hypothetical protein THRCLA_08236 [Thraustotheca clavata]|uniref:Protein MON2 homolog n=1 Tax=Thraustotheca clavata TaxID=74557 RepID=A0A1V9Z8H9_9STRA|nr:hypothetical protein THRCLA_08236 [Thraustotheca clavata]